MIPKCSFFNTLRMAGFKSLVRIVVIHTQRVNGSYASAPKVLRRTQQPTYREIILQVEALWSQQVRFRQYLLEASEMTPPNKPKW